MKKLNTFFQTISNVLECNYKHSSNLNHSGIKGDCRENFIKNFLKATFPQKFVIGSGEIIDSQDNVSKQADIVIYDENMPVFDYGGKKHFLSGGVLAHIEVKSKLNKQELLKSLDVTKSIKNLQRDIDAIMYQGKLPKTIPSFVFAYEGINAEQIKKYILEYYKDEIDVDKFIDGVCILNEASFLKKDEVFCSAYNKKDSLILFFIKLFDSISKKRYGRPNFVKYIENIMLMPFMIKEEKDR